MDVFSRNSGVTLSGQNYITCRSKVAAFPRSEVCVWSVLQQNMHGKDRVRMKLVPYIETMYCV